MHGLPSEEEPMSFRAYVKRLATTVVLGFAITSHAQEFPSRAVRIIDTFAPGGTTDLAARALAAGLSSRLGQQVIIDNRPGGNGIVGVMAAKTSNDGHTLLLGYDGAMVINPHTMKDLPYDTLRDFMPVTMIGELPLILVGHPSLPANNLRELIQLSKDGKSKLFYGTAGLASTPHLAGELLRIGAGLQMTHVPYKGGNPALNDVVAGQIPLALTAFAAAQQFVKLGRLKGLGVTGSRRQPSLPDIPTFSENGVEAANVSVWMGIFVPVGTSQRVIQRLHSAFVATLEQPDVRERYSVLGITPVGNTPAMFTEQIRSDLVKWGKVTKEANIKIQ
jgi:tripartite-type tricarboxylate transporter receptor subunit TctC